MAGIFQGDERKFAPDASDFWQVKRIPWSPLYPRTRFLRWLHTDSEENYQRRGNKEFSVESVGYEFNSLGYRGPELAREPGEALVMFIGDSNTLGLGMPWEGLWTSLVTQRLEQRWGVPVRQCNLGWGGTGTDYTAMMLHQTVDVLKPDAVFILWSFVSRMTWFADPRRQVHFIPEWAPSVDTQEHSAYLRLATEAHGFFNYIRNFYLVYDRLLRLRIPYYWGNLEQFSREMLEPYLPLDEFAGPWKCLDLARDGRHAGLKSHAFFASCLMSAMDRGAASRPGENDLPTAKAPGAVAVQYGEPSRQESMLDRMRALATRPIRDLIGNVRLRRRVRAMKRKDPFIY
jgi:AcrR family transcriptional regulator